MYHNRVKRQPVERTLYLITNRITGGSMIFGDQEKESLRRLMSKGEKRCGYEIWDYIIMGNHYHVLIYIPNAESMSQAEVLRRCQEVQLAVNRSVQDDPGAELRRRRIESEFTILASSRVTFSNASRSGIAKATTDGVSCTAVTLTVCCLTKTGQFLPFKES